MRNTLETRADWLAQLLSTEPPDRGQAEAALGELYAASGLPIPEHFFWFDSPHAALRAVALLSEPHDFLWKRFIEAVSRTKRDREFIDRLRVAMCQSAGQLDWKSLVIAAGEPMTGSKMVQSGKVALAAPAQSARTIDLAVTMARLQLYENVADAIPPLDESDDLQRAEHSIRGVLVGQNGWSTIGSLMSRAANVHYSFSMMALDAAKAGVRNVPTVLEASWAAARSAGLWWPFSRSIVLSDRPIAMHLNAKLLPHQGDGPAIVYRDGVRIWAWNGHAMREEWIMRPESISARDLKEFEPSFREYVAARVKPSKPEAKPRLSSILKRELPAPAAERVAVLREHNKGPLPFFDRYTAGEYEKVWDELIALGARVREDPCAADALAVAYETMRRVELNVREITERLRRLGYQFAYEPHEPPTFGTRKQIARLEKAAGALPLSIRAFYEIVGAVNWMGEHQSVAPRNDSVAPDPLVVFSIEEAQDGFDSDEGVIDIGPDDLHKANTSGGDPYQIAVPDLSADGRLLGERHDLYLVQYLRLVFRYGGFPGYDGVDIALPAELAKLRDGLTPF